MEKHSSSLTLKIFDFEDFWESEILKKNGSSPTLKILIFQTLKKLKKRNSSFPFGRFQRKCTCQWKNIVHPWPSDDIAQMFLHFFLCFSKANFTLSSPRHECSGRGVWGIETTISSTLRPLLVGCSPKQLFVLRLWGYKTFDFGDIENSNPSHETCGTCGTWRHRRIFQQVSRATRQLYWRLVICVTKQVLTEVDLYLSGQRFVIRKHIVQNAFRVRARQDRPNDAPVPEIRRFDERVIRAEPV